MTDPRFTFTPAARASGWHAWPPSLGASVVLCAAVGGESGRVLRALLDTDGIELRSVNARRPNGAYVHDRRNGKRVEVAAVASPPLSRHEEDELFGVAVTAGLECGVMLLTGSDPDDVVPADVYRRLAGDLRRNGCTVLADLTRARARGSTGGRCGHRQAERRGGGRHGLGGKAGAGRPSLAADRLRQAGAANVLITRAAQEALSP